MRRKCILKALKLHTLCWKIQKICQFQLKHFKNQHSNHFQTKDILNEPGEEQTIVEHMMYEL